MGGQIEQQATQAGGLGGYREAIMQAERQRNLGQQLQDIQATGDTASSKIVRQGVRKSSFDSKPLAQRKKLGKRNSAWLSIRSKLASKLVNRQHLLA